MATSTSDKLNEFLIENEETFWKGNKRKAEVDHLEKFLPQDGISEDGEIEDFRKLVNLHHDVWNNGGCNSKKARAFARNPQRLEKAMDSAIDSLIIRFPIS